MLVSLAPLDMLPEFLENSPQMQEEKEKQIAKCYLLTTSLKSDTLELLTAG